MGRIPNRKKRVIWLNYGDVLYAEDIAEISGIKRDTANKKCKAGEIPATQKFRKWHIAKDDFIRWYNQ